MNSNWRKLARHAFIDLDPSPDSTAFISGMARNGTTWLAEILNHDNFQRDILEPFLPAKVKTARAFKTNQYMRPDNSDRVLIQNAKKKFFRAISVAAGAIGETANSSARTGSSRMCEPT